MSNVFDEFEQSELLRYIEFESLVIPECNRLLLDFCYYCYATISNSEKYLKCLSLQIDTSEFSVEVPDELKGIGLYGINITRHEEEGYYLFKIIYDNFVLMLDYEKVLEAYRGFLEYKVIDRSICNIRVTTCMRNIRLSEFKYYTYRCLRYPLIRINKETKIHLGADNHYLIYSRDGRTLRCSFDVIPKGMYGYLSEGNYADRNLITDDIERELLQYTGHYLVYAKSVSDLFFTEESARESNILFYLDVHQKISEVYSVLETILKLEKSHELGILNILINMDYNSFNKKEKRHIKELVVALNLHWVDVRFLDTYRGQL